ncbi:MAG: class I SAM-dependent methyltransferase [Armatimonadetes bacterium]|nr:class I SAM-dependent methyltransferase [Armatimonadota bacterium]
MFSAYLSKNGHEVTAIDVVDASEVPGYRPVVYHGRELPFPDDSFDTVVSMFVLHHIEDCGPVVLELKRVTGRFLIVAEDLRESWWDHILTGFHNHSSGWGKARASYRSEKEWLRLFSGFGLRALHSIQVPRYRIPYYPVRRWIVVLEKVPGQPAVTSPGGRKGV